MKNLMRPIRGMHDLLDAECKLYAHSLSKMRSLADSYAFEEISTPIMEFSEVFTRTLGESSDIVNKETYTFSDRDKRYITLRPEFTAAIARAFISNGMEQRLPVKLFSHGPVFRHERPQKGRYRQFNQFNFEYLGSSSPAVDVEMIILARDIIKDLGIKAPITLKIHTIGDEQSRKNYLPILEKYLNNNKHLLSKISQERLNYNPLRILDSKDEGDRELLKGAPKVIDTLNEESKVFFERVLSGLDDLGIEYEIDHSLVRGLDYYTHTVFEMVNSSLGTQGTVIAGGRYDGLIKMMGGKDTPAFGFAAGVERLVSLLEPDSLKLPYKNKLYLIPIGEEAQRYSLKVAHILRHKTDSKVCLEYDISLKKRMQRANKYGADYAIIFGKEELELNRFKLKNMETGLEKELTIESLTDEL